MNIRESSMHEKNYLKDYQKTPYRVESINLEVEIFNDFTIVKNTSQFIKQSDDSSQIELDGVNLELLSIKLNGADLKDYSTDEKSLIFKANGNEFTLECVTKIYPDKNTALEGFYKSGDILCTQCEAQGFRKITYAIDRPDNMSRYTVKLIADKEKYPTLLSNGNLVGSGIQDDKHWTCWEDPFHKPSYIFAMVAGNLSKKVGQFTTKSNRVVSLEVYVEEKDLNKCDYALESLKRSMKWDEETYNLEYDLDVFMIVAVDSFNMGAMENKGLNIFNSACVLANPETANDRDFFSILAIIGHEYFHNWTGNRVTCRDWFQLTLKEGLTVYRDQEFTADLFSRSYQRISDVSALKLHQFTEDASALAHPIRPESYIEINNFYTSTIYDKGAEVIRMLAKHLGEENYFRGIKKYFELYDGQAVTTENFIYALEKGSGVDLSAFTPWYSQAGTPEVQIEHKKENNQLKIKLEQVLNKKANQEIELKAQAIPLSIAVFSESEPQYYEGLMSHWTHDLTLDGIKGDYTISFNRGFVAPIKLKTNYSEEDLLTILSKETDGYSCWEAMRRLWMRGIVFDDSSFIKKAIKQVLESDNGDLLLKASLLSCPSEMEINLLLDEYQIETIHLNRKKLHAEVGSEFKEEIKTLFENIKPDKPYVFNPTDMAKRSYRYALLKLLAYSGENQAVLDYFENSDNMAEKEQAFSLSLGAKLSCAEAIEEKFYNKWKADGLVMNKWIRIKSSSASIKRLEEDLNAITQNMVFDKMEPNKVRSLFTGLVRENFSTFHDSSFKGYDYLIEQIQDIDSYNKQLASALVRFFNDIEKYTDERKAYIKSKLKEVLASGSLSSDTFERIQALVV